MYVFLWMSQPPMWVTLAVLPSRAMWGGSTMHVDASVSPSQGEYTNNFNSCSVCVSEDTMVRIKTNQLQLLMLLHFFLSLCCVFLHVILREPNKTQVFSFFQTDLGGFLPRSVVDSFFPSSMAEFYSNLAKAVKSLKDLWHHKWRNLPYIYIDIYIYRYIDIF